MQKTSILFIGLFFLLVSIQPINAGIEISVKQTSAVSKGKAAPVDIEAVLKTIAANMVKVEGGSFLMGSNNGKRYEKPVHTVTLSSFRISKYLVTQAQWVALTGANPSDHKDCPDCPVEEVSYEDALWFIAKLNKLTDADYRLPTEAQWEYAARGGNKSHVYEYSGSDDLNAVGWYAGNSGMQSHKVGLKQPNELGLYDMSGNAWEWCNDWFDINYYSNSPSENPKGASEGVYRILRGGSWLSNITNCPVSFRFATSPSFCSGRIGFRLAQD